MAVLFIFKPAHHCAGEHPPHAPAHAPGGPPAGGTPEPLPHEHYELGGRYYRERTRGGEKAPAPTCTRSGTGSAAGTGRAG